MADPDEEFLPLARQLAVALDGLADFDINRIDIGLTVRVAPYRAGARRIDWIDFADQIVVQVGDIGGRCELGAQAEDIASDALVAAWRRRSPRCPRPQPDAASLALVTSDVAVGVATDVVLAGAAIVVLWLAAYIVVRSRRARTVRMFGRSM